MLLSRLRFLFVCLFSLAAVASRAQTTLNVGPNQPYSTIQSGIDAAHDGDTVLVAPGTYNENINFNGKAIIVTSSGGAAVTMISGNNHAATVTFATNETRNSVLSNFTIVHGGDGTYPGTQGGIYIQLASPTISRNTISQAGCYGVGSRAGAPLIQNNLISETRGSTLNQNCGDGNGSGIWLSGYSNPYGDYPFRPQQPPQILHNVIENNTYIAVGVDTPGGAGISVRDGTTPYIAYNIIRYNSVQGAFTGAGSGGGIQIFAAGATIANNLIYANSAIDGGGGIAVDNFGTLSSSVMLVNNTLDHDGTESVSDPLGGEELSFLGSYPISLFNNLLIGNSTRPAMVCSLVPLVSEPSTPVALTFGNNDLFNGGGPLTGDSSGGNCDYPINSGGNLATDPLFVSAIQADFHLMQASPAIDAGSNLHLSGLNLNTDLDNNSRIQDATGHGCIVDMGAYEYPGSKSVCGTQLTLTSSLNPSTFNQTVTFSAQLTSTNGTPTGSVQFSDGTTILGTASVSASGAAIFTTSQLTAGTHTITAAYQPTGNFSATSATVTQVVNGVATTTQLTSSQNPATVGQSITFTATVTSANGSPTGSVTFTDGSVTLATVPLSSSGNASFTTSSLSAGLHAINANFTPSGPFASSVATLSQTVNGQPTSTTVNVAPNPAAAFATLVLTSTVTATSGTPTGTVTFNANGTKLGSAPLNASGAATLSVAAPLPGTYSITAVYSGDASYNASTSAPVTETITAAASGTTLTASPNPAYQGQSVALNATVTGVAGQTPTGSVTFYDGSNTLGTAALSTSGTASLSVSTLSVGTHTLSASYQAAGAYAGSISAPVQETITPGTFDLALAPSSITLSPGKQGTVQLQLTSVGGFSGPLQLSYAAMPAYANATLTPNTVTLTSGGSGTASLLLNASTAQLHPALIPSGKQSAIAFATLLALLAPMRRNRRKLLRPLLGVLFFAALLTGVTGCGMIRSPFLSAAPGSYRIPVTATDSHGNSQTAILNLTVTP
jgi:hypothetical protein